LSRIRWVLRHRCGRRTRAVRSARCEWLEVSKSGYYEWRSRPRSAASKRRELLKIKISALFDANNGEYGYRRVHPALVRSGEQVDDETVRGLMRELGLRWYDRRNEKTGERRP
jgi:HTH-like domain